MLEKLFPDVNWDLYMKNSSDYANVGSETFRGLNEAFHLTWFVENCKWIILIMTIIFGAITFYFYISSCRNSNKYKSFYSITINLVFIYIFMFDKAYRFLSFISFNSKDIAFFVVAIPYIFLLFATPINVILSIIEITKPDNLKLNKAKKKI